MIKEFIYYNNGVFQASLLAWEESPASYYDLSSHGKIIGNFHVKIQLFVTANSDQVLDPDPHGSAWVWLPGSKYWSGPALKEKSWIQIGKNPERSRDPKLTWILDFLSFFPNSRFIMVKNSDLGPKK